MGVYRSHLTATQGEAIVVAKGNGIGLPVISKVKIGPVECPFINHFTSSGSAWVLVRTPFLSPGNYSLEVTDDISTELDDNPITIRAPTGKTKLFLIEATSGSGDGLTYGKLLTNPVEKYPTAPQASEVDNGPVTATSAHAILRTELGYYHNGIINNGASSTFRYGNASPYKYWTAKSRAFLYGVRSIPACLWKFAASINSDFNPITTKPDRICLYVWRPGVGLVGKIIDNTLGSDSIIPAFNGHKLVKFGIQGQTVSNIADGDLLIIEWWTQDSAAGVLGRNFYYGGVTPISEASTNGEPGNTDYAAYIEAQVNLFGEPGAIDVPGVGIVVEPGTEVTLPGGNGLQLSEGTVFPCWVQPVYQAVNIYESNFGNDEIGDPVLIRNAQEKYIWGRRVKKFRFLTAGKYVIDPVTGTPLTP